MKKEDLNSCAGVLETLLRPFSSTHDKLFYQYTSFNTLINGILSKDKTGKVKPTIRLSSLCYLNDSLEAKLGHEIFNSVVKSVANVIPHDKSEELCKLAAQNTFEASFSEEKDNLQMWSMYGSNGKGVSVGFNIRRLIEHYQGKILENIMWWAKCLYIDKNMLQSQDQGIIRSLCDIYDNAANIESEYATIRELVEKDLIVQLLHAFLVALAKNADYEFEKESRLIIFPNNANDTNKEYRLREDNIMVPYIDVEIPIECIEEVWVGPNQNVKAVRDSLDAYLTHLLTQSKSNHKIKVYESQVAYRTSTNV